MASFENLLQSEKCLRIHLIGVAGSGMSGLAALLLQMGHRVSGSDRVASRETDRLQKEGLVFATPHSGELVDAVDLVIYSSAIRSSNVVLQAARAREIPCVRRAEALALLMKKKKGLVVAGSHGKTTTSALVAHLLRSAGVSPSHYVGAEIPILGSNAAWEPESDYFVAEADESDGTLVHFHPEHTLLLNIEEEHLDFYSGLDEIVTVFRQLLEQTAGTVFYCHDDPEAFRLCEERAASISYGFSPGADYRARIVESRGHATTFEVFFRGVSMGDTTLNIPGEHNVLNALGAIALAIHLGVDFADISNALGTFRGAKRRFEVIWRHSLATIVDDYGHHPTEIAKTITTARSLAPSRLFVVFQPHRYSRTVQLCEQFATAFHGADHVFLTAIYPANETPLKGVSAEMLRDPIVRGSAVGVTYSPTMSQLLESIGRQWRPGDFILTLGAGDIHHVAHHLTKDLQVLAELRDALGEKKALWRLYEPLRNHTTLRVGGPAQFWVEPETVEGLARLVAHCHQRTIPVTVLGRGSNLLVRDGGILGLVVQTSRGEFQKLAVEAESIVAGAGVRFKQICQLAKKSGLGGFAWMEGIPGAVGGALRMNAGAMGVETSSQVEAVTYLDAQGQLHCVNAEEIEWQYRRGPLFEQMIAVEARFRGVPCDPAEIEKEIEACREKRKSSQPVAASAGCIFKNPPGHSAGALVEEMGLKNLRIGDARVSGVHGNFIVNEGAASARDVLALIDKIRHIAEEQKGIAFETEVRILGEEKSYL